MDPPSSWSSYCILKDLCGRICIEGSSLACCTYCRIHHLMTWPTLTGCGASRSRAGPRSPPRASPVEQIAQTLKLCQALQASSGGKSGSPSSAGAAGANSLSRFGLALCRRGTEHTTKRSGKRRESASKTLHKRPSRPPNWPVPLATSAALVTTSSVSADEADQERLPWFAVWRMRVGSRVRPAAIRCQLRPVPPSDRRRATSREQTLLHKCLDAHVICHPAEEHATRFTRKRVDGEARAQRADHADHSSHSSELVAPTASAMVDRVG